MSIGGSIQSISIDGRDFNATSDADLTIDMGGFKNETLMNGNATSRKKKERKPWKVTGIVLEADFANGDPAFLQNIADGPEVAIVILFVDDSTLTGTGNIEGDLTFSSMNSTASLEASGGGTLT